MRDLELSNRLHEERTGREDPHALRLLGDFHRDRTDGKADADRALEFYRRARAIDPGDPQALIAAAAAEYIKGHVDTALATADRMIRDHPRYWEGWYLKGLMLSGYERGRPLEARPETPEAIDCFTEAISRQPDRSGLYHNRGVMKALLEQEKPPERRRMDSALADLEMAATLQNVPRKLIGIHEQRINIAGLAGLWDVAQDAARELVRIQPGVAARRYNLAVLLLRERELLEAADALAEAVRLQPSNGEYRAVLERVHRMIEKDRKRAGKAPSPR